MSFALCTGCHACCTGYMSYGLKIAQWAPPWPAFVMLMQQTAIFSTSWTTKAELSEQGQHTLMIGEGTTYTNNGKPRVVSSCLPASEALPGWLDSHHMRGIPGRAWPYGAQRTHLWRVQSCHQYQWEAWIPRCQGLLFHVLQQTERPLHVRWSRTCCISLRVEQFVPKQVEAFDRKWEVDDLNIRFRFCKYIGGQGHYFGPHCDGVYSVDKDHMSLLTCMFYLNGTDDFEGGRINFIDHQTHKLNYSVKPEPGLCVIFQQRDLRCYHEGTEVTKGLKYIMRTDIMYHAVDWSMRNFEFLFPFISQCIIVLRYYGNKLFIQLHVKSFLFHNTRLSYYA